MEQMMMHRLRQHAHFLHHHHFHYIEAILDDNYIFVEGTRLFLKNKKYEYKNINIIDINIYL